MLVLCGERDLEDMIQIKDPERGRVSWMIWVGLMEDNAGLFTWVQSYYMICVKVENLFWFSQRQCTIAKTSEKLEDDGFEDGEVEGKLTNEGCLKGSRR
jgi:hypothetical protein